MNPEILLVFRIDSRNVTKYSDKEGRFPVVTTESIIFIDYVRLQKGMKPVVS